MVATAQPRPRERSIQSLNGAKEIEPDMAAPLPSIVCPRCRASVPGALYQFAAGPGADLSGVMARALDTHLSTACPGDAPVRLAVRDVLGRLSVPLQH
jgi:hypothetical protein